MARQVTLEWIERDADLISWYGDATAKLGMSSVGPSSINNPTGAGKVFEMSSISSMEEGGTPLPYGQKYCIVKTYTMDDIDIEAESQFETPESMIPWAGFLNTLGNIQSKVGGTSPEILNFMKVPTWQSTSPLQLNFQVNFYSMTDSTLDVLLPSLSLLSLTILKRVKLEGGGESYQVPGVFMGNMGEAMKRIKDLSQEGGAANTEATESSVRETAKTLKDMSKLGQGRFFAVRIENLITLKQCILESVKPKFSRQQTESGGPLWATVDLKIRSILPASSAELLNEFQNKSKDSSKVTKTFS